MTEPAISRRSALKASLAAGAAAAGGSWLPAARAAAAGGESAAAPADREPRRWHELDIIGDDFLDAQLLRALEAVWHGMGDIGECLDTASRIRPGDAQSHYDAWYATAERVSAAAQQSLDAGHEVSAGEAWMRACNYYRAAEFIDHDNPAARRSVECFQRALPLLGVPAKPVEIPYEGTTLPGYLYRSPRAEGRAPLLIAFSGFDGTIEEMKHVAEAAIARGHHCLLFAGPGQGLVIREQKLPFRHDWEKVVGPVVDFALDQPGVDPERLALLGVSFGGFLAPRAVAFERRIAVCIANPAVYNFHELSLLYHGEELGALRERDPEAFNAAIEQRMRHSLRARMALGDSRLKFGATSHADVTRVLEPFNNEPIAGEIRCRMLVMDGTEERVNLDQAKRFYDALRCPKHYMLFDERSAASLHCQTGAISISNQRMFDWLDEQLQPA